MSFSLDNQTLASADQDGVVRLWHRNGAPIGVLVGHTDGVTDVAFSSDGQTLASASIDGTARLWQRDGALNAVLEGHQGAIRDTRFSPDGRILATGSDDGTTRLWQTDGSLVAILEGHTDAVTDVVFSPDGYSLATGSTDGTVRLWQSDGTPIATLENHLNLVGAFPFQFDRLHFSPDRQILASAGRDYKEDDVVLLWNLDLEDLVTKSCVWLKEYMVDPTTSVKHRKLCESELPELRSAPLGWLSPIQRVFASLTGTFQTAPASRR